MTKIQAGDKAPDFEASDQKGQMVRLSDFKGRKMLLFFYPKANTSGCTTQATSLRDALPVKIFQVRGKLMELDEAVNTFLEQENIQAVVSVGDTQVTDDTGATIGLIRVVAYRV